MGRSFAHTPFNPARQARLYFTQEEPTAQRGYITCLRSFSCWSLELDSNLDLDPKPMSSTSWGLCCAAYCVVRALPNPTGEGKSEQARSLRDNSGAQLRHKLGISNSLMGPVAFLPHLETDQFCFKWFY